MLQIKKDKSNIYFNARISSGIGYGMCLDIKNISLLTILKLLYYKIVSFVEEIKERF